MLEGATWFERTEEEEAGDDAPSPSWTYMGGVRPFRSLMKELPDSNASARESATILGR